MRKTRIEVDRPCVKPGVTFEEREGGRFCLSCQEMQHDLRDATRSEALALIEANGGRICGTFRTGPSGELRFRAEPPPRAANAARGAALVLALAGCGSPSETASSDPVVASPPPSAVPPPPATPTADPPPVSVAPDPDPMVSHATDASPDAADHATHAHQHAPVVVGSGGGGRHEVSGGAVARGPVIEDGPRGRILVDATNIVQSGGTGTIDPAVLARMVRTRQSALQSCYERELRNNPTLAGRVTCSVTVAESGVPSTVEVTEDTTGDELIGRCAVVVLRSLRVSPPPEGGSVTFTVPMAFEPME